MRNNCWNNKAKNSGNAETVTIKTRCGAYGDTGLGEGTTSLLQFAGKPTLDIYTPRQKLNNAWLRLTQTKHM